MHAAGFGLGQHPQFPQYAPPVGGPADPAAAAVAAGGQPGMADPAQIQQLVQLLGAKMLPKQTAVVECPKSMVGRVIGKGGETIKSLQQYTGAMIQVGAGAAGLGLAVAVSKGSGGCAMGPSPDAAVAAHADMAQWLRTCIVRLITQFLLPASPCRLTSRPTPRA